MRDDLIHIYDPAGLNIEQNLDDLMGELIGGLSSQSVDLINHSSQLSQIQSLMSIDSDKDLSRIVAGMRKPRDCLLPSFDAIENNERLKRTNTIDEQ
jgi:hypothetical protein